MKSRRRGLSGFRSTEETQHESEEVKRLRKSIADMADEYVCPITQQLPLDPVTAEDGHIYERSAISSWLRERKASPVMGTSMGSRLLPAVQARSMIKQLVRSGVIDDKAVDWRRLIDEEDSVAEVRRRAEGGDVMAMLSLSNLYRDGEMGLSRDTRLALNWLEQALEKASDTEDATSLTHCALACLDEQNLQRNPERALVMLGQAVALGSDRAAFLLAWAHRGGRWGLTKDPAEALRWSRKMVALQVSQAPRIAMGDEIHA